MTGTPELDRLFDAARQGRLTRRALLQRAAVLGLSAPAIAALLAACGGGGSTAVATSAPTSASGGSSPTSAAGAGTPASSPTEEAAGPAGGKGNLRLLWWQAPTVLNAHLSSGTKDFDASRLALEPLADYDANNNLVPFLSADELPSQENGQVAADGLSVTWKLRQGVTWHDGTPFTANDVKFTFDYLSNPDVAATTYGSYVNVQSVDVVDDLTVKVTFKEVEPYWYNAFVGLNGYIVPQHALQDFNGPNAATAPFNLMPIGTGPFKVVDFKPGDVGQWERYENYWDPGTPHFDSVTMKGGGDATSAARAVIQTSEQDWAWNLQVAPDVLESLGNANGKIFTWPGGGTERLMPNHSDPVTEQNGQVSFYQVPHPHFQVPEVRQALAAMIQRDVIANTLYGPGGTATALTLNNNPRYMPQDLTWEFNLDKAKSLLDQAGAMPGADGIRELNGRKLDWVYQTSVNDVRQKTQEIIKAAAQEAGINMTIKAVQASVFFSGDTSNPDTLNRFQADLQMFTNIADPFPKNWYQRYLSANPDTDIAQQSNQWHANNTIRYQNADFNKLYQQVAVELDPDASTDLFLQMQRLVITDIADIGLVNRNNVAAVNNNLTGYKPGPFSSSTLWDARDWTMSE